MELRTAVDDRGYFGFLWVELNYPDTKNLDRWNLQQVARHEISTLHRVLRRALQPI